MSQLYIKININFPVKMKYEIICVVLLVVTHPENKNEVLFCNSFKKINFNVEIFLGEFFFFEVKKLAFQEACKQTKQKQVSLIRRD